MIYLFDIAYIHLFYTFILVKAIVYINSIAIGVVKLIVRFIMLLGVLSRSRGTGV
jgi:hypothetical protein